MKKLLLLGLTGLLVFSCRKDDEEISIVGVWKPTKTVVISGSNNSTLSTDVDACYNQSTFDFKNNNTVVANVYDKNTTTNACESYGAETLNYSYDSNTKKLTVDGEVNDVLSLTATEMQVVTQTTDFNNDNINDKFVLYLRR